MKSAMLIVGFLILGYSLRAQSLSPFVVSSSGGYYSNTSGQLSFTTGEETMVETFTSGTSMLTQGFQQVFDWGVYVGDYPDPNFSCRVYPNPTDGKFSIVIQSSAACAASVVLYDVFGKIVFQDEIVLTGQLQNYLYDLKESASGIYLMKFMHPKLSSARQEQTFVKIILTK